MASCLNCGKELSGKAVKYCSSKCQTEYEWYLKKQQISGSHVVPNMGKSDETDRRIARKYLMDTQGEYCAICGAHTWNGKPIPLVVDHIDGNPSNSSVLNLRLICPNCDAQLDTFKNKRGKDSDAYFTPGTRAFRKREEYDRKLERENKERTVRTRSTGECPVCGRVFPKIHGKQLCCSKSCARKLEIATGRFGSMTRQKKT